MKPDNAQDWDDPNVEASWLASQANAVAEYLSREGFAGVSIASPPAWFVVPYVAVWQFADNTSTEGWVVSGDLPTDFLIESDVVSARDAVRAFGARWREVSDYMLKGQSHPIIEIGSPQDWPTLGELLRSRANTFLQWADDESMWQKRWPDV